jgi:arsenite-transporting ATPase
MSGAGSAVQVFLGKGGVGKTTCSSATALALADAGERSLVLSTDPTPSLSHIFGIEGEHREREVLPNLFLTELGLHDVRRMWDERFGREVYSVFAAFVDIDYRTFVEFMTSVLPGLNEEFMTDYIRRLADDGGYRNIVWDTAPLGQTLALLGMPTLLVEHLRMAPRIYSHLRGTGEQRQSMMEVLRGWQQISGACIDFLREEVHFSLVTIPEQLAVVQIDGAIEELGRHGLRLRRIIVNNVVQVVDSPFLEQKARQQRTYLERLHQRYAAQLPIVELPLFPQEVRGVERLRSVGALLDPQRRRAS